MYLKINPFIHRDVQLLETFRLACNLLGAARGSQGSRGALEGEALEHALLAALLRLAHNCLTFDFIGTTSDESSDDLCTVQVSVVWVRVNIVNISEFTVEYKCE